MHVELLGVEHRDAVLADVPAGGIADPLGEEVAPLGHREVGGVRIEDDCWIHKDNCTPLNTTTKELLEL